MATLKDIGTELGLSVTTVSRALNGFPEVSAKTRTRVMEAARRLNYQPNRLAQKLVSGRSGMVGMIVRLAEDRPADRTFVEIMIGLSARLADEDVDLVFHVAHDPDLVAPYRRMIAKNTLDGFILNAPLVDDARIGYLEAESIPFVVHGKAADEARYPYYDVDNRLVSADAVSLLADLGHRRIGFLNGDPSYAYSAQRLAGFRDTLAERGLHSPDAFIAHEQPGEDYGYRCALAAFSGRLGSPPTAFVCASTVIAAGVMKAANDRGLSVPGDVSVVAHDDAVPSHRSTAFDPALTVTHAPLRDACVPLADMLLARLSGARAEELQTSVRAELVIRNSTGPVPDSGNAPWT